MMGDGGMEGVDEGIYVLVKWGGHCSLKAYLVPAKGWDKVAVLIGVPLMNSPSDQPYQQMPGVVHTDL